MSEGQASDRLVELLEEIRDNQRRQLQWQDEALALQRAQFEFVKQQYDRTEALQDRAAAIQQASTQLVDKARRAMAIVLPVIIFAIAVLIFLLVRM